MSENKSESPRQQVDRVTGRSVEEGGEFSHKGGEAEFVQMVSTSDGYDPGDMSVGAPTDEKDDSQG